MKVRFTSCEDTWFITNPNDAFVGKSLETYGEWAFGEIELMKQLLKPQQNVIEAGSYIGAHTVFIGRDVVPEGTVYAFEPRRTIYQMMCANVAINSVTNVHGYQLGVGSKHETMSEGVLMGDKHDNFSALELGAVQGGGEKISVVPLDSLMDEFSKIAFLKADIEGYEGEMLTGAQKLIARDRPMLYLENEKIDKSAALIQQCWDLGYDCWWHVLPLYREDNRAKTKRNMFPSIASFNMLCAPKELKANFGGIPKVENTDWHPLKR